MQVSTSLVCLISGLVMALGESPAAAGDDTARSTARNEPGASGRDQGVEELDVKELQATASELRGLIERFSADRGSLIRRYAVRHSPDRRDRLRRLTEEWSSLLQKLDFDDLSQDGQIDYLLFRNHLDYERNQFEIEAKRFDETKRLVPFAAKIIALEDARRSRSAVDPKQAAEQLAEVKSRIESLRKELKDARPPAKEKIRVDPDSDFEADSEADAPPEKPPVSRPLAERAAGEVEGLRSTLRNWFQYYNGYDPVFSWWVGEPYKNAEEALQGYAKFLREQLAGIKADDKEAITGDPIGAEALQVELVHEMIPYTPEELVAIARKELAWCDAEMSRASKELGYADDWHKALEHVKTLHVEPGKQPALIQKLADEAIEFLDAHDLVTVPALARESWRMEMMSPERQLVNPFFTGGEVISVSFPTSTMTHEQKLMSMRGNNIHFSRATVHHELIPGHHLQGFMATRYRPYRGVFTTPFSIEGWAVYWELLLWDKGFPRSPEDRIGMLFWRMHRCARIIFSLEFHLGKMTPQECVAFLVERVGHERANAEAEVRRSFGGGYDALYQSAYLLGALQLRALHKELVGGGKMTDRAFHDAVLKENRIPIEMVRARLTGEKLTREFEARWRFYGIENPADEP